MKATKRRLRNRTSTWPDWLLLYVATNNQQPFHEMTKLWKEHDLPDDWPKTRAALVGLMLDDYLGSGAVSSARYTSFQNCLGNERLPALALEVLRLHQRITLNKEGVAIEDIEQGLEYADELQHDGLTAYFLLLQGQHLYQVEHNITEARTINLRALGLMRGCVEQDPTYVYQFEKALANTAITSALDGDTATARALAKELTETQGERYLSPLTDILLNAVEFPGDFDTTNRQAIEYLENGQSMEALEWFIEAERLANEEQREKELCGLLGNLAIAFRRVGNYSRALHTYCRAIQLSRKHEDYVNLSRWNQKLARLLMENG